MFVTTAILATTVLTGAQDNQVEILTKLVQELRSEVADLKSITSNNWLNDQRADEIRGLVHDVLADADTRASLQGDGATAGYNGGAFLASADGNWKLKINGQLQVRWLYNEASNQNDEYGFEQRRTKLKFSGHVLDPSWTFKIVPTWNRDGGTSVTEDSWISKKLDGGSWFKFGQFKQNFLRENIVSSSKQLGVERSMVNNGFTYGWSQGIEFGYKNDDLKLVVQYTDGPGQANTQALGTSTNAWVARAEFRFGEASWKDFGYLTSKTGGKSGFLLGAAYETYDRDAATFEYGNANGSESDGWTIDASWRGDGWNIFGYLVETTAKDNGVKQDSSGWLIQGGFLVSDNTELFAQYQEGDVAGEGMDMDAFRIGFNYWPVAGSNNIKWTTDIGWAGKTLTNGAGGAGIASSDWVSSGNGWRPDNAGENDQMLIRTQLQLLF